MQIGLYFDQTRCTGCYSCVIACKDWHDVPAGPASWLRVTTIEKGKYPDLFVAHLINTCYHCTKPACITVCPVGAISKREQDGAVLVDGDTCTGRDTCGACIESCPYEAPQFGADENAKMQKCDLCIDRLAEHKKPICVDACPTRALDAALIDKLRAEYGNIRIAEGFLYSDTVIPSIIFKPKKDIKNLDVQKVVVAPAIK